MNPSELAGRFTALSEPWCSATVIEELLGIDLPGDPRLASALRAWSERFRGDGIVERSRGANREVQRHVLEAFLLQNGWTSWKWAAVHLALAEDDLKRVVARLEGMGLALQLASGVSDQVIRQRDAATLYRQFPATRMKLFSSHTSMCRALHTAIKDDLGLEIKPLLCVTSAYLEEAEVDLADAFDAITLDPVGLRYQVWLETRKPVNLRPDVCSLKFYARHQDFLRGYVMKGSEPDAIDNRLLDAA